MARYPDFVTDDLVHLHLKLHLHTVKSIKKREGSRIIRMLHSVRCSLQAAKTAFRSVMLPNACHSAFLLKCSMTNEARCFITLCQLLLLRLLPRVESFNNIKSVTISMLKIITALHLNSTECYNA